jgi:hypothetical protein
MKSAKVLLGLCAVLGAAAPVLAVVNVTVDPGAPWVGYMNVSELPENGGAYVFGSGWGPADLCAVFTGPVLRLSPNTINDPSSFWYTPSGGPGSVGNKIMDANMYIENDAYAGQTVNFSGQVLSNTFVSGYTSVAFIKQFAPDYSSFIQTTVALAPGPFSISLATAAGTHVQYGFETVGRCVWVTDVGPMGGVDVTAPEPATLALLAMGGLVALRRR